MVDPDSAPPGAAARRLADACGQVREAVPGDAVDGVLPSLVAAPAATSEMGDVLRIAAELGLAVTARGAGTKMSWGRAPSRLDLIVDLARMDRVLDHAAGDLVVHVEAGTPMAGLAEVLAGSRQRLMVEETVPGATVGGTIATATSGPRRIQRGTVRDLLIGVTLARADGVVVKAGGRVVKNVAGYDLSKLVAGSYGTLGIVTEALFRLHPEPEAQRFVTVPVDNADSAGRVNQLLLNSPLGPGAIEIDWGAERSRGEIVVLLEGLAAGVERRIDSMTALLAGQACRAADDAPKWWARYPWQPGEVGFKLTFALSGLTRILTEIERHASLHGGANSMRVRGSAGAGVLYLSASPADPAGIRAVTEGLRRACTDLGGTVVMVDGPPEVKAGVDSWGPVPAIRLMRSVKEQFDPEHRLSPGRFVGGI